VGLGRVSRDGAEVVDGLQPGDRVIVTNSSMRGQDHTGHTYQMFRLSDLKRLPMCIGAAFVLSCGSSEKFTAIRDFKDSECV
jgi:threonine dehydrogenase-like Zn-dependent dehydrogenase